MVQEDFDLAGFDCSNLKGLKSYVGLNNFQGIFSNIKAIRNDGSLNKIKNGVLRSYVNNSLNEWVEDYCLASLVSKGINDCSSIESHHFDHIVNNINFVIMNNLSLILLNEDDKKVPDYSQSLIDSEGFFHDYISMMVIYFPVFIGETTLKQGFVGLYNNYSGSVHSDDVKRDDLLEKIVFKKDYASYINDCKRIVSVENRDLLVNGKIFNWVVNEYRNNNSVCEKFLEERWVSLNEEFTKRF